jgi:hypothetical protein
MIIIIMISIIIKKFIAYYHHYNYYYHHHPFVMINKKINFYLKTISTSQQTSHKASLNLYY